ncbi:MAG TPA: FAD-dependent oxidoreductase [bacterium]|mgnify:CR=1 FL=1|nr:FAD-dependent oxidoreductase [bacterium]HPN31547.1 FAD-dependent oxidoreductase [bacterium]
MIKPKEFKAKLIEKIQRTPSVQSLRFSAGEKIEFIAGQFMQVIFDESNAANRELNKFLSFSCAPDKDYFEITKRLSGSKFSDKLRELKINDSVKFKAPFGTCLLNPDKHKKTVFLVGGIGITPVISILEDEAEKQNCKDIILFYANRNDEEIAFRKELDLLKNRIEKIKIFYIVSECKTGDENCVVGGIDNDIVLKNVDDILERTFFVYGPPGMVNAAKTICSEIGCKNDNILSESFTGY